MRYGARIAIACVGTLVLASFAEAQIPAGMSPARQCVGCDSAQLQAHRALLVAELARLQSELSSVRERVVRTEDAAERYELRKRLPRLEFETAELRAALQRSGAGARGQGSVKVHYSQQPRGYLGLNLETTYESRSTPTGWVTRFSEYPTVVSVEPGSPVERAGVRAGDILLSVNGLDAKAPEFTQQLNQSLRPGNQLAMRLRRGGGVHTLATVVAERPTHFTEFTIVQVPRGEAVRVESMTPGAATRARAPLPPGVAVGTGGPPSPAVAVSAGAAPVVLSSSGVTRAGTGQRAHALAGAELLAANVELARALGAEGGLFVIQVGPQTPASRAGLRPGDLIVRLAASRETATIDQLHTALRGDGRSGVVLDVMRNREPVSVVLRW